jgi:hypothetical protein
VDPWPRQPRGDGSPDFPGSEHFETAVRIEVVPAAAFATTVARPNGKPAKALLVVI